MVGEINEKISRGKIEEIILISEALQEGKISKIAEQISQQRDVKFVMIAGPSSSGKTTFSSQLYSVGGPWYETTSYRSG